MAIRSAQLLRDLRNELRADFHYRQAGKLILTDVKVMVVDEDGEQLGVLDTQAAIALAEDKGLDLVEVAPTARPPVCKIMDYGKFKYEQARKAREAKKKQHIIHVKEIKMRPKIEDHDFGRYNSTSQDIDTVLYDNPYLLTSADQPPDRIDYQQVDPDDSVGFAGDLDLDARGKRRACQHHGKQRSLIHRRPP